MRPRHAVLPTPSGSLRPVLSRSRTPITRQTPLIPSFVFKVLRTLPSSVSRKSCRCRSYENWRGVYQQFTFRNSILANQETTGYSLSPNSRICHTSDNSPGVALASPTGHGPLPRSYFHTRSVPTIPPTINYPLSFHILAHSFALTKKSTLLFSIASPLFAQKHRGVGEGHIDWYATLRPGGSS